MYYGMFGVTGNIEFPFCLFRALSGMLLGVFVFEVRYVFRECFDAMNGAILSALQIFTFIFPVLASYYNLELYRFTVICFIIYLSLITYESRPLIFRGGV